ncbi:DUF4365 domain-containing protein [Alkalinema sp. FACHB-956]|nr:DUF4365 domain-containing protein [Alkalinema sp. FACHB-956]
MHITQQQEQFSNGYLQIVASTAGCKLSKSDVDDDSVDFNIQGKGFSGLISRPQLDVQLKCYMSNFPIGPKGFSYPLKMKNYDDLRITDILVPRILIVVVVPNDISQWTVQSDHETLVKYCGYWASIRGQSEKVNKTSVSIHVPQANRLTVDGLRQLLQIVASGDAP